MTKAAERDDDDTSVSVLQSVLDKYTDYPPEVQVARDVLSNKLRTRSAEVRDELRVLTASRSLPDVDAGLAKHAKVGRSFDNLLQELREHRRHLLEEASVKAHSGWPPARTLTPCRRSGRVAPVTRLRVATSTHICRGLSPSHCLARRRSVRV